MGPVVIITGAGSGIGRATAINLSQRGCRLVLNGRRKEALAETGRLLAGEALLVPGDIGDPKTSDLLITEAERGFGRVDAIVSNAGWAPCKPIENHTPELIRKTFEVNALGPAYLFSAGWRQFRVQNSRDDAAGRKASGGCIVLVSSMATLDPFPGLFAYAAAKSSLNSMARSAAAEAADLGIRCFVVAPGAVETDMLREVVDRDLLPAARTLKPEQVAEVIAECVAGLRDEQAGQTLALPSP